MDFPCSLRISPERRYFRGGAVNCPPGCVLGLGAPAGPRDAANVLANLTPLTFGLTYLKLQLSS